MIVDSSWNKCSQKHSYNSKSGVGIIIIKEAGKILFMGVRSKYCAVCHNAFGVGVLYLSMLTFSFGTGLHQQWRPTSVPPVRNTAWPPFDGDGDSSVHPTLVSKVHVPHMAP